jgi:CsoR family transcriptional regulator, copper-sensing transcriptional repressor
MSEPTPGRTLSADARAEVTARLRRISGQVRGVERMVDENRDCRDVVTQLAAIKAAVASLNTYVAETYALDCLCGSEQVGTAEVSRLLDVLKTAR